MPAGRMHSDEVDTDASLVRRLLAAQFPQWADLPIEPVHSAGTDNAIYRLGHDMAVRLPRIHRATGQVDKEHQWLPRLAPLLPLIIPVPLAKGEPAEGYPWHWSVYRWLEGENATLERIADPLQAATVLAQFVAALQRIDPTGGPPSGPHNFFRSTPTQRPPRGKQPCRHQCGTFRPSGSTETCNLGTCWPYRAGSAPSSTSGAWAWAIPPAT